MDANELLRAYRSGMAFDPEASKDKLESATNSDFFQMVTTDTTSVSEEAALIVIPSNLNAPSMPLFRRRDTGEYFDQRPQPRT